MTNALSTLEQMNVQTASELNKMLTELEKSGQIKTAELLPSLNAVLSDAESGGFPGKAFLGTVKSYTQGVEMPSTLGASDDETHAVDQLEITDVTGDYTHASFSFNAANGGLKAKLSKLKDAGLVLVVYRGEMEPTKKGWNPAKDYGFMEILDKKVGEQLYGFLKGRYPKKGEPVKA